MKSENTFRLLLYIQEINEAPDFTDRKREK